MICCMITGRTSDADKKFQPQRRKAYLYEGLSIVCVVDAIDDIGATSDYSAAIASHALTTI